MSEITSGLYDHIKTAIDNNQNILLTGGAGVGKTYQTREIIKYLTKKGNNVARTASTGFASTHITGTTIHSFSGLGAFSKPDDKIQMCRYMKEEKIMNIQRTDWVVIDEASMISSFQLDLISESFKWAMKIDKPFGGLKMILVGDFFQLPPVVKDPELRRNGMFWLFYADSFRDSNFNCIVLDKVIRQKDEEFISILNQARSGTLEYESTVKLLSLEKPKTANCVQLYATNKEVDEANEQYLETLETEIDPFYAGIDLKDDEILSEKEISSRYRQILTSIPVKKEIFLKAGARVMTRSNNDDEGYVNGTTGTYLYECVPIDEAQGERDKYGELGEHLEQFFEEEVHYKKIYDKKTGMFTGLFELSVKHIIQIEKTMLKYFYHNYKNTFCTSPKLKVKLDNGNYIYVQRKVWEFSFSQEFDEFHRPIIDATFSQYPIALAKALTVHKSQGCTIDNVFIDFSKFRQNGQGYVALSRVREIEGLHLAKFNTRAITANPDVVAFYKRLENGLNY